MQTLPHTAQLRCLDAQPLRFRRQPVTLLSSLHSLISFSTLHTAPNSQPNQHMCADWLRVLTANVLNANTAPNSQLPHQAAGAALPTLQVRHQPVTLLSSLHSAPFIPLPTPNQHICADWLRMQRFHENMIIPKNVAIRRFAPTGCGCSASMKRAQVMQSWKSSISGFNDTNLYK